MKEALKKIMTTAWMLVKKNGFTLSEALKVAWRRAKLVKEMNGKVVKFYFEKVDGTMRQAYGTLRSDRVGETHGGYSSPTVQVYWDCEKDEWRCFKIANLLRIA